VLPRCASSSDTVREIKYQILHINFPRKWGHAKQLHFFPGVAELEPDSREGRDGDDVNRQTDR
jgi:hypothetical protein